MTDDVFIITGGTRGIGRAVADRLAGKGRLVLAYRSDSSAARRVQRELSPLTDLRLVRADVSVEEDVRRIFENADQLGTLVGLVNSAGVLETQAVFEDISPARWRRILEVNVVATAHCCQLAVERMSRAAGGAIVNMSSRAAVLGSPGEYVDYAASKAAVDTLSRGLALEVAPLGIRVNAVRPGIIETDLHRAGGEPARAARLGPQLPMGRAGRADEVAAVIEWLLSADASYVTGSTIDVSGGR